MSWLTRLRGKPPEPNPWPDRLVAYWVSKYHETARQRDRAIAALSTPPAELREIYMTLKEQTVEGRLEFLMVELKRRHGIS